MTRFLATTAALVLLMPPAFAQSGDVAKQIQGTWNMTSLQQGTPGGKLTEAPFTGQIIFTEGGVVAVQAMNTTGDDPGNPYAVNGYEAYYGTYAVAPDGRAVTFNVEASVVRNLIGQSLERAIKVTDGELVITPTSQTENWRVTYDRK